MTLIVLASLLLLSHAQTSQAPSLGGQQASVEQVLSSLQSADPNLKGEALAAVAERPTLRQDTRVRQAVVNELRKARAEYVNRQQPGATISDHRSGELLLALIRTAAKFDGPEVVAELLPHL